MNKCPICGKNLRFHLKINNYNLYYCIGCCLNLTYPMPSKNGLISYYNGFLFHEPKETTFQNQRKKYNKQCQWIINYLNRNYGFKKPLKILDYGGGVGLSANGFAKLNNDVVLAEVDQKARQYAKNKFGNIFTILPVSEIEQQNDSLQEDRDFIYINQVIEHLPSTKEIFRVINRTLRNGGIFIITTPNQKNWEHWVRWKWIFNYFKKAKKVSVFTRFIKFIQQPWTNFDPPRHLYVFNEKNLTKLLENSGFKILKRTSEYGHKSKFNIKRDYIFKRPFLKYLKVNVSKLLEKKMLNLLSLIDVKKRHGNNLVIIGQKIAKENKFR